jgi:hypothetical protein
MAQGIVLPAPHWRAYCIDAVRAVFASSGVDGAGIHVGASTT